MLLPTEPRAQSSSFLSQGEVYVGETISLAECFSWCHRLVGGAKKWMTKQNVSALNYLTRKSDARKVICLSLYSESMSRLQLESFIGVTCFLLY